MIGRTPGYIVAVRPLRGGAITDFDITERMIRLLLQRVGVSRFTRPKVVICVPSAITEVERRAVTDATRRAGAADAQLLEQPMAAAIGAGLPVEQASGSMVVDIGGGTTEIAIISLNGVVYSESVRVGGDRFDEAIVTHVRRNYGSLIGDATAERVKKEIGCAYPSENGEQREIDVRGRNLAEGVPRSFTISSNEILEALTDPLNQIVSAVKTALEHTPPELGADIADRGMMLTGGGALLRDLDRLLDSKRGRQFLQRNPAR